MIFENRHYSSLNCHYRAPKNAAIGLNRFLKNQFQNRGISLISLGKGAKCWIFFLKEAFANFCPSKLCSSEPSQYGSSRNASIPSQFCSYEKTNQKACESEKKSNSKKEGKIKVREK